MLNQEGTLPKKRKVPDALAHTCPEAFPPLREGLKGPIERLAIVAAVELVAFAKKVIKVERSASPVLSIDILLNPSGPSVADCDLSSVNLRLLFDQAGGYAIQFGGENHLEMFDQPAMDSLALRIQTAVPARWTTQEYDWNDRGNEGAQGHSSKM